MGDIYFNSPPPPPIVGDNSSEAGTALTGEQVARALYLDQTGQYDYTPTHEDYIAYNEWHKTQSSSILHGMKQGASQILEDFKNAGSSIINHPLESTAKLAPSLAEAFLQGSRNLYGMVAQSQDPDSVLFRFKDALSGSGSDEGYSQFLEARNFNKHSARLASGEETIAMDKDIIDHNITQAASYIADPTLFIPFGTVASAGIRAVGMGEKLTMLAGRASAFKGAVIGGTLKYGVGMPIEFLGDVTRGSIDRVASVGGAVIEATTGLSAKELKATARMAGVTGVVADAMGGHIPVVSQVSNAYIAAGAASGVGSAVGAVGEQILKQGGKRGFNSFAVEALKNTPNLSNHAQNLLKILDKVDPFMSYSATALESMGHGAVIGGTLGYLSGGKEGLGHGMGAGIALGGIGGIAGRVFADSLGAILRARAEVQGQFVLEGMKQTGHQNYAPLKFMLDAETANRGEKGRAEALQVIAGIDKVGSDIKLVMGDSDHIIGQLKDAGFDIEGFRLNDKGERVEPPAYEFGADGLTITKEGKEKGTTIYINTDRAYAKKGSSNVVSHELFHAIFRTTVMESKFKDMLNSILVGKYDEKGNLISRPSVALKDLRGLAENYYSKTPEGIKDKNFVKSKMMALDEAIVAYKKSGGKLGVNPDGTVNPDGVKHAEHIDGLTEEFGAYYFSEFLRGKPLDYLFKGGDLGGVRGMFDSLHNGFLNFWENKITRENPTFDFRNKKVIEEQFGNQNGKRVRIGAVDYMMQELIRAKASQRVNQDGSYSIDVRKMNEQQRAEYFNGSGADGLKHAFDKKGQRVTDEQETASRAEVGSKLKEATAEIPKEDRGDLEFHPDGSMSGIANDKVIQHWVSKNLISNELAKRLVDARDAIVNPNASNIWTIDYHGGTKEIHPEGNMPRLTGDEVPVTHREVILVGTKVSINKKGVPSLIAQVLDKTVLDKRGDVEWAKPEVQELFGTRKRLDTALYEYFKNAGLTEDEGRVPSAELLDGGDGKGALRRNTLHQISGLPISESTLASVGYKNQPNAPILKGTGRVIHDLRLDLMSNVRAESNTRVEFNNINDQAYRFISQNFKVSEMKFEETPNGRVYEHESGYKLAYNKETGSIAFDSEGKQIGKFNNVDDATNAMSKAYNSEQAKRSSLIEKGVSIQDKHQASFKVIDEATRKEASEKGDIFQTAWGQEFSSGTKVVPQTREEFILNSMVRLRQSDPKIIRQVVEAKVAEVDAMKAELEKVSSLRMQAYKKWKQLQDKQSRKELDRLNDREKFLTVRAGKYDILDYAVKGDRAKNADGEHILSVINDLRENSGAYGAISKMLFGDAYDKQFKTGEAFTTTATHGTNSDALIKSMEFDAKALGEAGRHGHKSDSVGAFLAGSTSTSNQYSYGNVTLKGETPMRQVRALVKMENPFVIDLNYKSFDQSLYNEIFAKAKQGGHDGVLIQNVYDGGAGADSVFVPFADKLKDNTAILDTVNTTEEAFQNADVLPAERPSTPRGTQKLADLVKGSYKVGEVLKETGFDKFINNAKLSGRLIEGRSSTDFAGRPVVIINYDNSGVWRLTDSKTEEIIGEINGGAMHNIISGEINKDNQPAVLASVNGAGLGKIEEVRNLILQKIEDNKLPKGTPLTFVINSGTLHKSLSHPQVANTLTSFLGRFLHQGVINGSDVNTIIKDMSNAYVTKKVGGKDVKIATGLKLKHLIDKSPQEQISFLQNNFLQQNKSTFDERSSTMDRFVMALGDLESVKSNKDYFKKFFGNEQFKPSGKSFKNELLKITDDPITRDKNGESIGYGKIVAVLEVPSELPIVDVSGGHTGFPVDYRSKVSSEIYKPAIMSILDTPVRIEDMINRPSNKDIGTRYLSSSGKERSTSEMIMNTTSTFGNGIVKEGSHSLRPDTPKEQMLTGKQIKENFKVSEPVKEGVVKTSDIYESNNSILPKAFGGMIKQLQEAIRRQDATDEIIVPQVRQTYELLRSSVQDELLRANPKNEQALKALSKTLNSLDSKINKNQTRISKNVKRGMANDMQTGSDIESAQIEENKISHEADMQEGENLESAQLEESKQNAQTNVKTSSEPQTPQPAQPAQPAPEAQQAPQTVPQPVPEPSIPSFAGKSKAEIKRQQEQAQAEARTLEQARKAGNVRPSEARPQPQLETEPALPQAINPNLAYRGWTPEKSPNGSIWKNAVGYVIVLTNNKLKVYNPQKALLGIYGDLDQAKRRVQREEPKSK